MMVLVEVAASKVGSAAEVTVNEDESSSLTTFPTACINLVDSLGDERLVEMEERCKCPEDSDVRV